MDNSLVAINKAYVLKIIEEKISTFSNAIEEKNIEIHRLKKVIDTLQNSKTDLAVAYAEKLGVLLTKKQYQKLRRKIILKNYKKGLLNVEGDEEFVSKELDKFLKQNQLKPEKKGGKG